MKKIDTNVPLTKENADKISSQRAEIKSKARDLMSDQGARVRLDKKYPVQSFEYYKKNIGTKATPVRPYGKKLSKVARQRIKK